MASRLPNTPFSSLQTSHLSYCPISGIITNNNTGYQYTRIRKDGYLQIKIPTGIPNKFNMVLAHRLAYYLHTGMEPDHIDHISGVRHDNRWCNLRNVTFKQNGVNKKKHASQKLVGAQIAKSVNVIWRCQATSVRTDKRVDLGYYKSEYDAHMVRTLYMKMNYGDMYEGRDLDRYINGVLHPYFDGTLEAVVNGIKCNSKHNPIIYMSR